MLKRIQHLRPQTAALFTLLLALLLAACGGKSELDTTVPTVAGGASGAAGSSGLAGKAGTSGSTGGASAAGGTSAKGGSAGVSGSAGGTVAGGSGGTTGKGGSAGVAGSSGSAGATSVASITVSPAQATITVGTSVSLTATALMTDGTKMNVTGFATWAAMPANVTVKGGLVTGVSAGASTVSATFSGKSGTAAITVSSATPTKLSLAPSTLALAPGGTQQLTATLLLSDGSSQDVTKTAAWNSSAPSTATVSASGVVTAVAAGSAQITAMAGGLSASASVQVSSATLASISVSPVNPTLVVASTQQLTATGTFSDGTVADVTTTAKWSSSDTATLSIDAAGLATALAQGTSIATATLSGVSGSTTVTVTTSKITSIAVTPATASIAVGGTTQLTATATFADGSTLDVTASATWQSSAAATASVSNGGGTSGLVTGVASGSATVSATLGGATGSSAITVISGTLVSLAIVPSAPTVPIGTSVQLKATGTFSDGSTIDQTTSVTWTTADATIATIGNGAQAGLLGGASLGSTTLTVSLGGITANATVTVSNAVLASITVAPDGTSIAIGKKESLTATGVFSDGSTLDVTQLAVWSSSSDATATVSNVAGVRGQVAAVSAGSASITATYMGKSGSASLTVTQPAVTQLVISPTNQSRPAGQQVQFSAVAIFDNGTQQNVTLMSSWSSSDAAIAPVNAMGRVTATTAGTVTITATWKGLMASTNFTVSGAVLASIAVSPINPTLVVGNATPFSATAIFSDGTSQNIGGPGGGCTWTSSDVKIATVSTGGGGPGGGMPGLVTAVGAGNADIVCSFKGLTGSSTVTVTDVVIESLVISPGAFTGAIGATQQFTAQVIYNDGTSMDVTQASTWQSDKPTVATVTTGGGGPGGGGPRGFATAVSAGNATISATYKGVTGTAPFLVTSATLTGIVISPPDATTPVGVKVKLTATATYSDGSSMDVTNAATWLSSDASIAAVGNGGAGGKGLVTPIAAGTVTITANALGQSGTTSFSVIGATLTSIQVTPFTPTLPVGYATAFQATGIYSDNSTQDLTGLVTWVSTSPSVASVSNAAASKGRVSPLAAGSTDIQATYMGVTGSTTVNVTDSALQSITVAPSPASVAAGQVVQFTASGDFGGGLVLDITAYVTWASSDTSIAAISNATASRGQAKGISAGTVTITAVKGAITGTSTLTVN